MSEIKRREIKSVVEYQCDKEGCDGFMYARNRGIFSTPASLGSVVYLHVCQKCGEGKYFNMVYPIVKGTVWENE